MRCQFKHDDQYCPRYALEHLDLPLPNGDKVTVGLCRPHRACVDDIQWAERKRTHTGQTYMGQQTRGGH